MPGAASKRQISATAGARATSQTASSLSSSERIASRSPAGVKTSPCDLPVASSGLLSSISRSTRNLTAQSRSSVRCCGSGSRLAAFPISSRPLTAPVRRPRGRPARSSIASISLLAARSLPLSSFKRSSASPLSARARTATLRPGHDLQIRKRGDRQDDRRGGGRDRGDSGMPAGDSPDPPDRTDAPRLDRLSVQESPQVFKQLSRVA